MSDAPVTDAIEVEAAPSPTPASSDALADGPRAIGQTDVLALMRDALKETTPTDTEPAARAPASDQSAEDDETEKPAPTSRRGRAVERARTEAEERVAAAEARAAAAEQQAAQFASERQQLQAAGQNQQQQEQFQAEYLGWIGDPAAYAEAQRLSRLDPDGPDWDWDRHREAVTNLEAWDQRRRWSGIVAQTAEQTGEGRAFSRISKDFLETLALDLPEEARAAYRGHQDGIPGAVRFYAETLAREKVEALEAQLAERDAEIARMQTGGRANGHRTPAAGAPSAPGQPNFRDMSAEEMMSLELRSQARSGSRRRS